MEYTLINGEGFYKIPNADRLRPFFMSIVSDSDHWMFISSNGGLTAGRRNNNFSLFPYYSDDKITESCEITGSKTVLRIKLNDKKKIWEPFSDRYTGVYEITRNLYKNEYGNKIIFEEINHDLLLSFQYSWRSSDKYGFVKTSKLTNQSTHKRSIEIVDGLQNILPHGVNPDLQQSSSNLIDAYKKSELLEESGLGLFSLSAIIVDKAEPSEALKTNVAWAAGIKEPKYLLSNLQLNAFRKGDELSQENDIRAEKGSFLVNSSFNIEANEMKQWYVIADVNKGPSAVVALSDEIRADQSIQIEIEKDIAKGTQNLINLTFAADGKQLTSDQRKDTRHFANVMFNIMRGGIFDHNYELEKRDFEKYLKKANKLIHSRMQKRLGILNEKFTLQDLLHISENSNDQDFKRLCLEYLPLKFSRRHGDPSRPWNKFSINTKNELDGSKVLDYQGNWRDIFQNWEALAHSYPKFIQGMIYRFLNASTFDGYNPYRVTKDGFDWETIEPDDPWSYIGYWGDHQIIYLLKFLEFVEKHEPGSLEKHSQEEIFTYANVPYRIKSYPDIIANPKDTIDFDEKSDHKIRDRRLAMGSDGALLQDKSGDIYHVNFTEKILATVLSKCSNFIPEGGIWMNTQRPEWNDANNALVGNGVSMVTLYYLRRFLLFYNSVLKSSEFDTTKISKEMVDFFIGIFNTFQRHEHLLRGQFSNQDRRSLMDSLGMAGSDFRNRIYEGGFSGEKAEISKAEIQEFTKLTLSFIDQSIQANKRKDALYHSYNLMTVENDKEVSIAYLSEMLEGQVAVLSSGVLTSKEALALLDSLRQSKLYRADQNTYLLYPNRQLPLFINRNNIPEDGIKSSTLLQKLVEDGNLQILERDIKGGYHFNGDFNNAKSLKSALESLDEKYKPLVEEEESQILEVFEKVFNHKSFTGRSGTFYGYEGLGSIYWHMVSKLALAVQECCLKALDEGQTKEVINRLKEHYYEIVDGIGVHKTPELYGAFPTDPYSHTPAGKGAQQPGMTGQVKEDILTRFGELGVRVKNNEIYFEPGLLNRSEFLQEPKQFNYVDLNSAQKSISLSKGSLAFTYCQVPIILKLESEIGIEIDFADNGKEVLSTLNLGSVFSEKLFERSGEIEKITVKISV